MFQKGPKLSTLKLARNVRLSFKLMSLLSNGCGYFIEKIHNSIMGSNKEKKPFYFPNLRTYKGVIGMTDLFINFKKLRKVVIYHNVFSFSFLFIFYLYFILFYLFIYFLFIYVIFLFYLFFINLH